MLTVAPLTLRQVLRAALQSATLWYWVACGVSIGVHFAACETLIETGNFTIMWLGYVGKHWFLFVLLAVYFLAIGGVLARPLGIPTLFRDRPKEVDKDSRTWKSYAIWSAISAVLLLAEIWVTICILEKSGDPKPSPWWAPHGELLNPCNMRIFLLSLLANGGPFLILLMFVAGRQATPMNGHSFTAKIHLIHCAKYAFGAALGCAFVGLELWLTYTRACIAGWTFLFGLHLAAPFMFPDRWRRQTEWRSIGFGTAILAGSIGVAYGLRHYEDFTPYNVVLGIFLLVLGIYCAQAILSRGNFPVPALFSFVLAGICIYLAAVSVSLLDESVKVRIDKSVYAYLFKENLDPSFIMMVGFSGCASIAIRRYPMVVPAYCIKMLLTWIVLLYMIFVSIQAQLQLVAAMLVVGWVCLTNSQKFKYRFPNMAGYYTRKMPVAPEKKSYHPQDRHLLCDDFPALKAWRKGLRACNEITFTTSG